MSEKTPENPSSSQAMGRMTRVSPLTIGAICKKGDRVSQGYVLNLSLGGLFLSTKDTFGVGDTFHIRFFLPFQLGEVDADVVVRWSASDSARSTGDFRPGIGVEFIAIEPAMRDKIGRFIDRFVGLADMLNEI